ncbi:unnamed protein product [Durusdinium trenchii]|uniref:Uncharacterized protein n=1 Tax=Durusdinium trenchii TaxID=1381693 RepID=A0ABP0L0G7_9DINO
MSRDSTVSALPSQGWSCETLERGIVEAARVSGVNLNPESLSEVTKSVMMAMQANGATKQNVAVVKTEPVSPRKQALTPPSAIKAGFNSPTLFQQMCSQQTIPGDIGDLAIPPVPAPSSATHGEGTPAVPTPPVHATGLPLGLPNVSLPAERSHGGSGAASPAGSAQSQAEFVTKCKLIRERLESRETEKRGKWYTEDQLKKSNQFSAVAVRKIISYCKKFPESLVRPWQYNDQISEYYVIVDDQTLLKKAETTIEREETQLDDKTSKDAPAGLPKDLVNIPDPTPSLEVVGAQPVADLEAYMGSLEKKQQSVEKMVDTLGGSSDENAKKLHGPLQSLDEKMKASFGTLGSQLTELKMDHRDGKLESDRLSALLKEIAEEKQTVKTLCTSLIPLDSRYRQLVKDLNLEKGNKKNKKGKGKGKANKKEKTAETASGPKKTPKSKTSKASKGKPSKKAKVPRKGKKTLEHQSEPSQKGPKRAKKTT